LWWGYKKERPLHKIKENLPHWAELEILQNGAVSSLEQTSLLLPVGFETNKLVEITRNERAIIIIKPQNLRFCAFPGQT